jgi:hypothetical protein
MMKAAMQKQEKSREDVSSSTFRCNNNVNIHFRLAADCSCRVL